MATNWIELLIAYIKALSDDAEALVVTWQDAFIKALSDDAEASKVTWWDEFIKAISDGAWTATLLQGLIAGAAAIAVAFWIFRGQLAADRELAKEEKIADAATTVGRILVQIAHSTHALSNIELGVLLRSRTAPPDLDLVKTARIEAATYFPSFNQHVAMARTKERDVLFSAGRNVIASNDSLTDYAIGSALRKVLRPAERDLRLIGNELIRWSGRGDLPDCLSILESIDPLPTRRQGKGGGRDTAPAEWKKNAELEIEATAKTKVRQPPVVELVTEQV